MAHFSVIQREPFRNNFSPSRRHNRQTGPRYFATALPPVTGHHHVGASNNSRVYYSPDIRHSQDVEIVALLTRPTPAATSPTRPESAKIVSPPMDAPFPMRHSRFTQKLNVPKHTPSPFRSLRPCLRNGASWRAGAGRIKTVVFLSILRGVLLLS
jgi:hypothetical protein